MSSIRWVLGGKGGGSVNCNLESCRVCPECEQKFKTFPEFQKHKATAHLELAKPAVSPNEFRCNKCDKTLSSAMNLQRHQNKSKSWAESPLIVFGKD